MPLYYLLADDEFDYDNSLIYDPFYYLHKVHMIFALFQKNENKFRKIFFYVFPSIKFCN